MVRAIKESDYKQISDIYNYYIKNTQITFEEELVSESIMMKRGQEITKNYPWVVFEKDGKVLGYAYASRWKSRKAYDFSVETSIYVDIACGGQGIGTSLYIKLLEELKKIEVNAVIGGVALPNESSVKLHQKLGFTKVAEFPAVGCKFGQWLNVGYWQLNLMSVK